jgi:hypothetical protein
MVDLTPDDATSLQYGWDDHICGPSVIEIDNLELFDGIFVWDEFTNITMQEAALDFSIYTLSFTSSLEDYPDVAPISQTLTLETVWVEECFELSKNAL